MSNLSIGKTWLHIARHEAGHAIAHLREPGGYFSRVLIRPGEDKVYVTDRGSHFHGAGLVDAPPRYIPLPAGVPLSREYFSAIGGERIKAMELAILSTLAGPVAEAVSRTPCIKATEIIGRVARSAYAYRDRQTLKRLFIEHGFATGCNMRAEFHDRAYELVREEWHSIVAIADELLIRHRLEFEEVIAILGHPTRNAA